MHKSREKKLININYFIVVIPKAKRIVKEIAFTNSKKIIAFTFKTETGKLLAKNVSEK